MRAVVAGANGNLGRLCLLQLRQRPGCEVIGLGRSEMDLGSEASIRAALAAVGSFDLLINCAAWTDVDACEADPAKADQINGHAVGVMGSVAAACQARVIHVSTDYVFDGSQPLPYREDEATGPVSVYGSSKRLGEERLLNASPNHLVLRVSWLFGSRTGGFPRWVIRQALKSDALRVVSDKWGSPTSVSDAAEALGFLAFEARDASGLLHFCNSGQTSWRDWGQEALDQAAAAGLPLKTTRLGETTMEALAAEAGWRARRPVHSALCNERYGALRGEKPRSWQEALAGSLQNELASLAGANEL
ncbi:MAG: dTDP-4-dehydrorhamnose reductase [Verrucomicrobia bacterium]|nr:MAG: dTDP-4-dehydrorhamnose reductase [Verrucomicrobiota bacterium]